MSLVLILAFSKLSLATVIMAFTPVSCYYMTSFSGKKARDVGLICRCHLSNVMSQSILYDSMEWGMTCCFLFLFLFFCFKVITTVFLSIQEMDSVVLSV